MSKTQQIASLTLCLLVVGGIVLLGRQPPPPPTPGAPRLLKLYGKRGLELAKSYRQWDAYRLRPDLQPGLDGDVRGYAVTGSSLTLDRESFHRLYRLLLDPLLFREPVAGGCDFQPKVALSFVDGADRLDLLFCFRCDEVEVHPPHGEPSRVKFARGPVLPEIKRIFPKDEELTPLE